MIPVTCVMNITKPNYNPFTVSFEFLFYDKITGEITLIWDRFYLNGVKCYDKYTPLGKRDDRQKKILSD